MQEIDTSLLARINHVLREVQTVTYAFEGSLNKFLVDDKGSTVVIVFGLPPLAHEDDPERATIAGHTLAARLRGMGMACCLGITSGVAFCGPVGAGMRREYSVIGDVVNTSARLMQVRRL